MSTDPNYFSEQRQVYATGTTINLSHINIQWTNPQTAGQMMTTYNIPGFAIVTMAVLVTSPT